MRARKTNARSGLPGRWLTPGTDMVGDVTDLRELGAGTFDVVIDKGTMDSILVSEPASWSPGCRAPADPAAAVLRGR